MGSSTSVASKLGGPPGRASADASAGGELTEGEPVARDEHVARILTSRNGREDNSVRCRGREVLVGVDGDVDVAAQQRLAQRRDEDPGATDVREGRCGAVALGRFLYNDTPPTE